MTDPCSAYQDFHLQLLAGSWQEGRGANQNEDRDPYNHQTLVTIRHANKDDVNDAYIAAEQAQQAWSQKLAVERVAVLEKAAGLLQLRHQEIKQWLVRESGSTHLKASLEINLALAILKFSATLPLRLEGKILAAGLAGQESRVYRKALGVVGVISPWNFPLHLTMRSLAPALALGNAVVVKPASDTPVTGGLWLAKLFEEAGLPLGVLSVVVGSGREIGDYFVEHRVPRLISFTGSTEVGRGIGRIAYGGRYLKRVALELGGNAPLVVLAGADLEQAAEAIVVGSLLHQGQICMSTNRVIVEAQIHDQLVAALVQRVRLLPCGDPNDPRTVIGPLINTHQTEEVTRRLAHAVSEGAVVEVGGEIIGNVIPPHVLSGVDPAWAIAREETFGPVITVLKAQDKAHALVLANDTEFGLSSAVFAADIEQGVNFAQGIDAGMTHVNGMTVDDQPNAPFGGEKNSGIGRFNGEWALEEFTRTHWITVQTQPRKYPF